MFPSPNSKFKKRCVALDKDEEKKQKKMQLPHHVINPEILYPQHM